MSESGSEPKSVGVSINEVASDIRDVLSKHRVDPTADPNEAVIVIGSVMGLLAKDIDLCQGGYDALHAIVEIAKQSYEASRQPPS